jgi:hypothetical protein
MYGEGQLEKACEGGSAWDVLYGRRTLLVMAWLKDVFFNSF